MSEVYIIEHDAIWPRDEEHRYRLYALLDNSLNVLAAAPNPGGIGEAIFGFDDDLKEHGDALADLGRLGILDVIESRWIVNPFPHGDHV